MCVCLQTVGVDRQHGELDEKSSERRRVSVYGFPRSGCLFKLRIYTELLTNMTDIPAEIKELKCVSDETVQNEVQAC